MVISKVISKKWLSITLLSLTCLACTNSKLVLRPLYNSIDNRMEKRFLEYTSFDEQQTENIQDLADHFHVWHRQTQLEYYNRLLSIFADRLNDTKSVNEEDVASWGQSLRSFVTNIGACNPMYSASDILASLSDQQIQEIRTTRQTARESRRARRDKVERDLEDLFDEDEIREQSIDERIKRVTRYLRFINFSLNKAQLDDLRETMGSTIRPETSFRQIRDNLDAEFYTLLDKRSDPDFRAQLTSYLDRRQQIFFDWREESFTHNTKVWEAYALRTIRSLNSGQRDVAKSYLTGLASTVRALASDPPSYTKRTALEYPCAGQQLSL